MEGERDRLLTCAFQLAAVETKGSVVAAGLALVCARSNSHVAAITVHLGVGASVLHDAGPVIDMSGGLVCGKDHGQQRQESDKNVLHFELSSARGTQRNASLVMSGVKYIVRRYLLYRHALSLVRKNEHMPQPKLAR